jgi:PPOX class probable F420-dependent enzyme
VPGSTGDNRGVTELAAERGRVEAARVGRLATVDAEGRPHLVPICFALDGETLYSAVDEKPKRSRRLKRLENVGAHPDVTVLVDHYEEDWSHLWWVRLRGKARVVEEGQEYERALSLLTEKYAQYEHERPRGPVIAIELEEWRSWSAAGEPSNVLGG